MEYGVQSAECGFSIYTSRRQLARLSSVRRGFQHGKSRNLFKIRFINHSHPCLPAGRSKILTNQGTKPTDKQPTARSVLIRLEAPERRGLRVETGADELSPIGEQPLHDAAELLDLCLKFGDFPTLVGEVHESGAFWVWVSLLSMQIFTRQIQRIILNLSGENIDSAYFPFLPFWQILNIFFSATDHRFE